MADLTVDRATPKRCVRGCIQVPVAANTYIPGGIMVATTTGSGGYAVPTPNAAGGIVLGVSKMACDNLTATHGAANSVAGAHFVEVEWGVFEFDASSVAITQPGTLMKAIDNHTVDETYDTNDIKAGILIRFISATKCEVLIDCPGLY